MNEHVAHPYPPPPANIWPHAAVTPSFGPHPLRWPLHGYSLPNAHMAFAPLTPRPISVHPPGPYAHVALAPIHGAVATPAAPIAPRWSSRFDSSGPQFTGVRAMPSSEIEPCSPDKLLLRRLSALYLLQGPCESQPQQRSLQFQLSLVNFIVILAEQLLYLLDFNVLFEDTLLPLIQLYINRRLSVRIYLLVIVDRLFLNC